MYWLEVLIGVMAGTFAFFPGILVGGIVGWVLPWKFTGFASCLVAVVAVAKLIAYLLAGTDERIVFVVSALALAFWALPTYLFVSWGRTVNDAQRRGA